MRIDGPGRSGGIQPGGIKRPAGTASAFALPQEAGGSKSAGVTGTAGLANLSGLIALQAMETATERRKRSVKRGHALLDELEDIKFDLLGGAIPPDRLDRLAQLLGQRDPSGDDHLDSLMDDIELRARVELAKLGRYPD